MEPAYLRMRMKLVLGLWPHIQRALASPWSNIRSICYGLVCSMLKVNVSDYPQESALSKSRDGVGMMFDDKNLNLSGISGKGNALSNDKNDYLSTHNATYDRLKEIVQPMLYSLLSSKESESKAGGLNILGSFCGLSYDFSGVKIHQNLSFL